MENDAVRVLRAALEAASAGSTVSLQDTLQAALAALQAPGSQPTAVPEEQAEQPTGLEDQPDKSEGTLVEVEQAEQPTCLEDQPEKSEGTLVAFEQRPEQARKRQHSLLSFFPQQPRQSDQLVTAATKPGQQPGQQPMQSDQLVTAATQPGQQPRQQPRHALTDSKKGGRPKKAAGALKANYNSYSAQQKHQVCQRLSAAFGESGLKDFHF